MVLSWGLWSQTTIPAIAAQQKFAREKTCDEEVGTHQLDILSRGRFQWPPGQQRRQSAIDSFEDAGQLSGNFERKPAH
jgi:hypothetical protein